MVSHASPLGSPQAAVPRKVYSYATSDALKGAGAAVVNNPLFAKYVKEILD